MQVKLFLLSNNIITANIYNIVKAIKTLSSAGAACLSKALELDGDDDDGELLSLMMMMMMTMMIVTVMVKSFVHFRVCGKYFSGRKHARVENKDNQIILF